MTRSAVNVYVHGQLSGTIARSGLGDDVLLFGYDPDCDAANAVSLTMPVVPDQYDAMGTVHPIFEMNLPEGQLRERLERLFSKVIPDFDALSLLELVGGSQIGRLRYARDGNPLQDVPGQDLQALLTYRGTGDLFRDLMERFAPYSGISGMQPKVLVREQTADLDRITERGATHIVKSFSPTEFPELAANEYFCMQAARHAGLPTAKVQLSANRQMLVVERFDLVDRQYLGFEDFCVLNGMRAGGRYQGTYEQLAMRIGQFVSPQRHAESMRQLFGALVLACAIGNGDAHLKNFGILYAAPGQDVRLAPVYDMVSTLPYFPRDGLALELNGSKAFPDRRQLGQFGRHACSLSSASIQAIFEKVAAGVNLALHELNDYAASRPDFTDAAEKFSDIMRRGVTNIG